MSFNAERRRAVKNLVKGGLVCSIPGAVPIASAGYPAYATVQVSGETARASIPGYMLGFNVGVGDFEARFWSAATAGPVPGLVEAMAPFKGSYLRYPGGLEANVFSSDAAIGPMAQRPRQRLYEWAPSAPVMFGPAEYFKFAVGTGMRTWYTLNLAGWHQDYVRYELPSAQVAAANARLATLRVQMDPGDEFGRLYHLGNELDRQQYEWPLEKYVARCLETMDAVRAVDRKARFVAFLRDFDYTYTSRAGVSRGTEFSIEVLNRLTNAADGSLQIYYDRPANEGPRFDLAWRWRLIDNYFNSLAAAGKSGTGFWVTEHAQYRDVSAETLSQRERLATTSGIVGALASADFVLGVMKRSNIRGAFWHALGGGVWWNLFEKINGVLTPTPAYAVFKLMRAHMQGEVLKSTVSSSNVDAYTGGYDINAAVVRVKSGGGYKVFVVNRAASGGDVTLAIPALANKLVQISSAEVAAACPPGTWLDEMSIVSRALPVVTSSMDAAGQTTVSVSPRSMTVLTLAPYKG